MLDHSLRRQRGLSLIETMVGLLIGMFVVLIILKLLSTTSVQQRIAVSSGGAQLQGTLATHILVRELQQAGLGISNYTLLHCGVGYTTTQDNAAVALPALAPLTINPATSVVPAGDANTDTLLVFSGSSASPSEGDATTAVSTSTGYTVAAPATFAVDDWVTAASVTRDTSSACALSLGRVTGVSGNALTVTAGTAGLPIGSAVFNLGRTPAIHAYAVRNGVLTVCDYLAYQCGNSSYASSSTVWVPMASHIASLRAQYARDTSGISGTASAMSGVIDTYDQVTPGGAGDGTSIPTYCRWLRVLGVRLAVVARGQQYDAAQPTTTAPTWSGSVANTSTSSALTTVTPTALPINLSSDAEWTYYRYKVIETTLPLRNAIWQGNQVSYQGGSIAC